MNRYRRSILKRDSEAWRKSDPQLAALVERYEGELRKRGLIDFEDMPLLAVRALAENPWLRRAVLAKYPALIVDEYQDLGQPLHRMVLGLCFSAGVRLFAVGDADQSIYGFTGAYPELLQQLSRRSEVETVQLRFNYRSGSRIVTASKHALGEERGYRAREGAPEGAVYFHAAAGSYEQQADALFQQIIPELAERIPDLELGHIAVLYPAAWIGDRVALAAAQYSVPIVRTDTNALYPRSSRMMRWVELCAQWCCTGWRKGEPRFSRVISEGLRLFYEVLRSNEDQIAFRRLVVQTLWQRRDPTLQLHQWLKDIQDVVLQIGEGSRTLGDELQILNAFIDRTSPSGSSSDLSLADLGSDPNGQGKLQLSSLHSSKGREFRIVILFGMDEGRIPRNNPGDKEVREARRLFYVGLTRAKEEVHLVYTPHCPSRFVREIKQRLEQS